MRFVPVLVIVGSVILYHVSQKNIPKNANPWAVLTLAYAGALIFTFTMWAPWKLTGKPHNLSSSVPMALLLALACVGIEAGYLYAYQNGWQITRLTSLASAGISIALLIVGTMFFQETIGVKALVGFLLASAGVVLMQLK